MSSLVSDLPVKVAVVGLGALGEHHARIYSQLPEAALVTVVDIKKQRAQRFASLYQCLAHGDYRRIPDAVEAVSLAVPTSAHAEMGTELLSRGIHLLVEKPICDTLAGADRLIEAQQKQKGLVFQVGHSERFNPAFQAVRAYVGKPLFFEAHRLGVFVPRSLDIDVVLDLMIHDLDLILQLVKRPIRDVRAVGVAVLTREVDIANARLEFEDGCVANITASRVSSEKIRKLRFFQKHDYVSIDFHSQKAEIHSLVDADGGRKIVRRACQVQRGEPLELELQAFLRAVRGGPPLDGLANGASGEEGKAALALALRVLQQT